MENSIQSYHLTANNQVHPGPLSHSGPLKPEHRSGGHKRLAERLLRRHLLRHAFRPYSRFLGGGVTAAFALQAARQ